MDTAEKLLTKLNFSGHPEATAKIVQGGDLQRVALLFGILPSENLETKPEEEDEPEEEITSSRPTRRKSRFLD